MRTNEGEVIANYIRRFLSDYVPSQKSGSPNTLIGYTTSLRLFLNFLEEEKDITLECFTGESFRKEILEEWIVWMRQKRKCGLSTCRNRLSLLRTFLKYLYDKDPAFGSLYLQSKNVNVEKPPKTKVDGLSREAVKTLLSLPDQDTRAGRRDMALMEVMYVAATRIDEVLSMKISSLHLDDKNPNIIIQGKGSKTRTLYVPKHTVTLLKKYVQAYHGENPDPDSYVFYSNLGGFKVKTTQPAIAKRLKMYAAKGHVLCADVPIGLHAHQFRHARATHWLEDGMNIVQISFLLGHENLETTMRYLDVTEEEVNAALASINNNEKKDEKKKWKEASPSLADLCGVK